MPYSCIDCRWKAGKGLYGRVHTWRRLSNLPLRIATERELRYCSHLPARPGCCRWLAELHSATSSLILCGPSVSRSLTLLGCTSASRSRPCT